jgi:hypothetical protein
MTQTAEFRRGLRIDAAPPSGKIARLFDTAATLRQRHDDSDKGRMRRFRDNIKQGSWFALLALTINLALSFGHFHATDGKVVSSGLIAAITSAAAPDEGPKSNHPAEGHVDVLCPICVASSALAHAFAATPPLLPVAFASVTLARTPPPVVALFEPQRAAFQSRGPPLS